MPIQYVRSGLYFLRETVILGTNTTRLDVLLNAE